MLEVGTPECMIKDGKPYKSKKAKLLDVLLTNNDYTPISKSEDHSVADRTVVDLAVLIKSLASFVKSKCIDFNDFADAVLDHVVGLCKNSPRIDIVATGLYVVFKGLRGNPGVQDLSSMVMPSCHLILMTFCRTKTKFHSSTSS